MKVKSESEVTQSAGTTVLVDAVELRSSLSEGEAVAILTDCPKVFAFSHDSHLVSTCQGEACASTLVPNDDAIVSVAGECPLISRISLFFNKKQSFTPMCNPDFSKIAEAGKGSNEAITQLAQLRGMSKAEYIRHLIIADAKTLEKPELSAIVLSYLWSMGKRVRK